MAIWQFCLSIIPVSSLISRYGIVPEYLDREIAIDIPWWRDLKVHLSDIQYLLDEFGPVQE